MLRPVNELCPKKLEILVEDAIPILKVSSFVLDSSVVPNNRNPMWGEEFDFYAEELPVQVYTE